jgi:hypothetical protein
LPPDPVPWDAPSRFGATGRFARMALRRLARPLEIRQRAREEQLFTVVQRLEARVLELENRRWVDLTAEGHQVGWAAGTLGLRIDELDRRVGRATALANAGLDELGLFPGRRVVRRFGEQTCRRAICSLAVGPFIDLLAISASSYSAYARRWGWDLVLSTENLAHGRPPAWAKVPFIRELLDDYEWILWIDSDAVFVDLEADIGAEQEPCSDLYLVEHRWGSPPQTPPNTGVLMIRSSDWSRELLDAMWDREALIDHVWWENAALMELLGYSLSPARLQEPTALMSKVKFLDLAWNTLWIDSVPKPRINHYAGLAIEQRREHILTDVAALRDGRPTRPLGHWHDSASRDHDAAWVLVRSVRSRKQLPELFNALGLTRRGAEIGVCKGEFSELVLSRWRGEQLVSIDPWQPDDPGVYQDIANVSADQHERFFGEAQGRLSAFGQRSQIWRLSSAQAAAQLEPGSLDFVYLDARHDEESVTRDLALWWPRIRVGGVLAGHDYLDGELPEGKFGVKSAVDKFFGAIGQPIHVASDDQPWPSWMVLRAS